MNEGYDEYNNLQKQIFSYNTVDKMKTPEWDQFLKKMYGSTVLSSRTSVPVDSSAKNKRKGFIREQIRQLYDVNESVQTKEELRQLNNQMLNVMLDILNEI